MKQRILTPGMPLTPVNKEEFTATPSINSSHGEHVLLSVDVTSIDPNPLAPREIYTPGMIAERAEALRVQGQHDPIHLIPNEDKPGRYIIVDGWTRVLACINHGVLAELRAEVHLGLSLEDSAWFGYQQNEERQQHCDFDRAFFYEKLLARGELATVIARKAKISNALLSYYRSYAKLPIEILELVRTNPLKFGANSAYQLLKLNTCCGLRTALAVAIKYSEEDQTYRWLVNQVQAHATPLSSTAVVPSKQIKYVNGSYKQKGSLFEVSINVPIDQKADFALALERLLDTVAIKEDASRSADV